MLKIVKEKLIDPKTGKLKTNVIIAIGLLGIMLVFLSGLDFGNDNKAESRVDLGIEEDTDDYRNGLEAELESILSCINGAGRVSVMISLEGTTEYVYAQQVQSSSDVKEASTASDYKNEFVILNGEDGNNALVTKVLHPKISGVLIVCDGGGDAVITEKLINSAAAALGVSSAKICVSQRTK